MKKEVGMYWNWKPDASSRAEGSSVRASTKTSRSAYEGRTFSATAEISRHDCQLSERNSR
jgi:hypothetical protein